MRIVSLLLYKAMGFISIRVGSVMPSIVGRLLITYTHALLSTRRYISASTERHATVTPNSSTREHSHEPTDFIIYDLN